MKPEEVKYAILDLEEGLCEEYLESDGEWTNCDYNTPTIRIAIQALEKQVPKKPLSIYSEYTCPMCEVTIAEKDEYCYNCGQRIDWGESE